MRQQYYCITLKIIVDKTRKSLVPERLVVPTEQGKQRKNLFLNSITNRIQEQRFFPQFQTKTKKERKRIMNEKRKIIVSRKREQLKTADIYQAAYLLAKGAVVEDLELIKELDKDVCLLILSGESITSHQQSYINNQALIDPVLYQKAINRIKDIVFKAVDKASNIQGGSR